MEPKEIRRLINEGKMQLTPMEHVTLDIQLKIKLLEVLERIEKKLELA